MSSHRGTARGIETAEKVDHRQAKPRAVEVRCSAAKCRAPVPRPARLRQALLGARIG